MTKFITQTEEEKKEFEDTTLLLEEHADKIEEFKEQMEEFEESFKRIEDLLEHHNHSGKETFDIGSIILTRLGIRIGADGIYLSGGDTRRIMKFTPIGGDYVLCETRMDIQPDTDNEGGLGASDKRWNRLYSTNLYTSGEVIMTNLPTSNPSVAGKLWNDGGVVKISAG